MTTPEIFSVIDAAATRGALGFDRLIPALRDAFASGATVPPRHHHHIPQADGHEAVLLLMPAWQKQYLGVKIVTIYSGNTARALPGLYSTYLLSEAGTGRPLALVDGNQVTARRTAGVAALGASFLARADAASLLVVGAGRVASLLADAFRQVRPIQKIAVWDVDAAMAARLVAALKADGLDAAVAPSLEDAACHADIISCATLSTVPLICAGWLKPGAHLDLIGSFTARMREAEDEAMAKGPIFVDTLDALNETGDLTGPIAAGVIQPSAIKGTLAALCKGEIQGRTGQDQITIFKAVGTALADITAAALAYETVAGT
jgi:ornithine cyclodeaminase/alanine dehydrogenase-like protein (mu-crystallin family)